MQLYARHAKPVLLRLEQSNDALDLFACASSDGKSVCLFAINPGREPVPLSCRFDGFAAALHEVSSEALCDTLDARQPDVMNHWEAPERIKLVSEPAPRAHMVLPAYSASATEWTMPVAN